MSDSRLIATGSQTIGPFFHVVPSCTAGLDCLVRADAPGERIDIVIRVLDGDGAPVPDALIELWQPDAGFGRLGTNADGCAVFQTIRPARVPDGSGGFQAPHINVCVFARGLLRHLYTRMYFPGDPALNGDPLLALVPPDRRPTLLAEKDAWRLFTKNVKRRQASFFWVIRLQGEGETVFFDL